ncbi:MAG: hypothetical protein KJP00_14010 [Bacteroidia bacterium]|nr:hypothetical protein [Bacteroidia bacterium]
MNTQILSKSHKIRIAIGVGINLIIAAIHAFRIGSYLHNPWYTLYYSYASDIMLPFGVYFLLCINEIQFKVLRPWYIKAGIIFGAMTFSEILQYFEIYFFGVTFDLMDIAAYATGTMMAVVVDRLIFRKFIIDWNYE